MTTVLVSIAGLAVTILLAVAAFARGIGQLDAKMDAHGSLLETHRAESREANAALRDDISELRRDAHSVKERVIALETEHRLRAVK